MINKNTLIWQWKL